MTQTKMRFFHFFAIGIILVLSSILFLHNLGNSDFQNDEYQVIAAAEGFRQTGTFYKWDFLLDVPGNETECIVNDEYCRYTRAWPHTVLVAASFQLFGVNETAARLPSAVSGILFSVIVYFSILYLSKGDQGKLLPQDNIFALLTTIFILSAEFHKIIFNTTRMYALALPIFMLIVVAVFKIIKNIEAKQISLKKSVLNSAIFLLLLIFGYLIHINLMIIIPAIWIYCFFRSFSNDLSPMIKKQYRFGFIIGLLALMILAIMDYLNVGLFEPVTKFFTILIPPNFSYILYNYINVPQPLSSLTFFLSGIPLFTVIGINMLNSLRLIPNRFAKTRVLNEISSRHILFLSSISFVSICFFTFIADRYPNYLYSSFVVPVSMILISTFYFAIFKSTSHKLGRIIATGLIILFLLVIITHFSFLLNSDKGFQNKNFRQVYSQVLTEYKEGELLAIQYPRKFYLRSEKVITLAELGRRKELSSEEEQISFEEFKMLIKSYDSGWVMWEDDKAGHLRSDILKYIRENMRKIHGEGLDKNRIEVYYFEND